MEPRADIRPPTTRTTAIARVSLPGFIAVATAAAIAAGIASPPVSASPARAAATEAPIRVVDTDVALFWRVYDRIRGEPDPARQAALLQRDYLDAGSPGLAAFGQAKGYTAADYVEAIRRYPGYWDSIRARTAGLPQVMDRVHAHLRRFRALYPALRPAEVYFEIGALRSAGTTLGDKVLIGAEMAAGDPSVDISQLPPKLQRFFRDYFASMPAKHLDLLVVHELVHTQERGERGSLLAQALYEGVADFVAERVTGRLPDLDYVRYGPANETAIKAAFQRDMHGNDYGRWLYNDADNAFSTRDLGYYVGYAICDAFYRRADDEAAALARMIELDFADEAAVRRFVDESGYFAPPP